MKSKPLVVFLSLLFPGLGQLYLGKYVDAVVFIAGTSVLWYALIIKGRYLLDILTPRFWLVISALVIIYLFSLLNALRSAR